MKLLEKDRYLLQQLQHRRDEPLAGLSKAIGIPPHRIRYFLSRFASLNLIQNVVFVDYYRLGFIEARVFVSLLQSNFQELSKMIGFIRESCRVNYIGEVGGDFQFAFSIYVESFTLLFSVLSKFLETFAKSIRAYELSLIKSSHHFGVRYLSPAVKKVKKVTFSTDCSKVSIDETDWRIIDSYRIVGECSIVALSRQLKLPNSTVAERIQKLVSRRVIAGFGFRLSSLELNLHTFYVLLNTRGARPAVSAKLLEFCDNHVNVLAAFECIGSWDYAVIVQGEQPFVGNSVGQQLSFALQEYTTNVRLLPSLRVYDLWGRHLERNEISLD